MMPYCILKYRLSMTPVHFIYHISSPWLKDLTIKGASTLARALWTNRLRISPPPFLLSSLHQLLISQAPAAITPYQNLLPHVLRKLGHNPGTVPILLTPGSSRSAARSGHLSRTLHSVSYLFGQISAISIVKLRMQLHYVNIPGGRWHLTGNKSEIFW